VLGPYSTSERKRSGVVVELPSYTAIVSGCGLGRCHA
jgi:hypothetical protein